MVNFPTEFAEDVQALTPDMLDEASQAAVRELADKGYEVRLGLTPAYAEQIKRISQEPLMREYVPRDAAERFADGNAAAKWLGKGRAVFLLVKKTDLGLVGYGWAGPGTSQHVPGGQTTWAVRVGEAGQGQGLSTPFSALIVSTSEQLYGADNWWLETWSSNGAAVHVYHKLGFKDVTEVPAERAGPEGEPVADSRVYMSK